MGNVIGRRLGRYQIDALIGRGAMGEVYRGRHTILNREVAVKTIYPHLAEDETFIYRFQREANLAASLRHPHIVQILDFDVQDGMPYMVMEYIGGQTLKERLRALNGAGQHMAMPELLRIAEGVASALDYAHGKGTLHRDVKSSNILIAESGDPVLVDFGIARMQGGTQVTATGAILGTPAYLSPEQGRGDPADARSDIYSLGIVVYEMIAGAPPFTGDSATAIIMKHLVEPPPGLRGLRPELPPEAEQVCLKALAKEPGDRYQTAQAMTAALRAALDAPARPLPEGEETIPEKARAAAVAVEEAAPAAPAAVERTAAPVAAQPLPQEPTVAARAPAVAAQPLSQEPAAEFAAPVAGQPEPAAGRRAPPWRWIIAGIVLVALVSAVGGVLATRERGGAPAAPVPPLPQAAFGFAVDNAGPGFRIVAGDWGTCWHDECGGAAYPPDFRYADPGCTVCEARFEFDVPQDGVYDVWAWWPNSDDRATGTPFVIRHADGELVVRVDQRNNGSQWYRLERLPFRKGTLYSITVLGSETGYANADAVALTLP